MRIIVDTNIFISAGVSKGIAHKVFIEVITAHTPLLTEDIIHEYAEVMKRKKFKKYFDTLKVLIEILLESGEAIIPSSKKFFIPDKDDEIFLQAMEGGNADILITVNGKDFISSHTKNLAILTPREFSDTFM